ncbi:MAG: hypothetical protein WAN11_08350, partial [Syntrophobacteraceae bacterium]
FRVSQREREKLLRKVTGFRPKCAAGMTKVAGPAAFHGFRVPRRGVKSCYEKAWWAALHLAKRGY